MKLVIELMRFYIKIKQVELFKTILLTKEHGLRLMNFQIKKEELLAILVNFGIIVRLEFQEYN